MIPWNCRYTAKQYARWECAGYVIYSSLKERTWFKEVSKKAIKQTGTTKEKTVDSSVVDRSDYLVGTPHDLLQKKKTTKKAK